jgi:hypothetical protein
MKEQERKFGTLIAEELKEGQAGLFPGKVPIEKLRAIWNDEEVQYSDEELYKIRDWLYMLANTIINTAGQQPGNNNTIELKPQEDETEESHSIRAGEHRRAS